MLRIMLVGSVCLAGLYSPILSSPIQGAEETPAVAKAPVVEKEAASPATLGIVKEKPATGRFVEIDGGFMVPYEAKLPGTDITYTMVPIPGGKFMMGSPEGEKSRKSAEGPQVEIEIAPFWMSAYEVTWAEYKTYMALHDHFKKFQTKRIRAVSKDNEIDAITAPSNLYDPTFTFKSGSDPKQPALSMSQYAAKQYTKWLSLTNGRFYRLPSEAEWEYAARAGTKTAYSFGDDDTNLGDYGWYYKNSEERTHLVGKKKPNPWGLYDIHGNVAEWVLDEYSDDYSDLAGKTTKAADAINWPEEIYPRVVRGGSFDDSSSKLRSAARVESDDDTWRAEDPNIPLSPWWFTSDYGLAVGMRVIRPLDAPKKEDRETYWKADHEDIVADVLQRINDEGRGALGIASPDLPAAIQKMMSEDE